MMGLLWRKGVHCVERNGRLHGWSRRDQQKIEQEIGEVREDVDGKTPGERKCCDECGDYTYNITTHPYARIERVADMCG